MNFIGKYIVAPLVLLAGVYGLWQWHTWSNKAPPKSVTDPKVIEEELDTCQVAEIAKGAKDRVAVMFMIAVLKNRMSEMKGEYSAQQDFESYALYYKVGAKGTIETFQYGVRYCGAVVSLQGEWGKGGMPARVALAREELRSFKKKGESYFDYATYPQLRCVARLYPHRETGWARLGGSFKRTLDSAMKAVYSNPAGSVFYCPK